jgi:isoleucyl-tRNA synthetase
MKAGLPTLEPQLQAKWDAEGIYHRIQEARKDAPVFVLHDGPPYTNSPIHLGTAMNKMLKDYVVKSRSMMGYRAPYVPGYDNHGLPIEQAVARKFAEQKRRADDIREFRQACRDHAAEFVSIQSAQFQRLGVFGLWEKPYATMNFRFEAEIVRVFKRIVEGGYVYKGLRPTLWSPTAQTALADTEIVYKDHVSKAIYVRFPLRKDPNRLFAKFPNLYTIIWTTTPWTIPSNLAVAFHPELEYSVAKVGGDHYVVATALLERTAQELGWTDYEVVYALDGINLNHVEFSHPVFDRPSIAVMATYVTTDDGTGVVHTAPSHGRDDFYTGQEYGLPVPNTVDERGYLTAETGEFAGTYYADCDTVVVDRLRELGALLKASDYSHSYPHAERDDKPVIFRATEQWFVSMDHKNLRARMLELIRQVPLETITGQSATLLGYLGREEKHRLEEERHQREGVTWIPATGHNRISAMVANRPDWCISRQRPWGVGIPIFYGAETRRPVMDPEAIEAVARLVEQEGSDAWFLKDPKEILPPGYRHPETGETEFVKETDVLDVWFDSGSTSICVLEGNVEPEWEEHWPADMYLEGSDQHRGWFNSSLIIGTTVHGRPPYRQVLTHGFVTDEKGEKMSKRKGNVLDPVEASEKHGADILRYWMASVDYTNDVPCGDNLLKQFGENYRNVRNTLRFLLGNLAGHVPSNALPTVPLDRWVVQQTDLLTADCVEAYERYDFGQVINSVHNFCREELSKFYLDSIKDRMYCEATDSPERRSGQAACHYVLDRLIRLLAPILAHTAEETWLKLHEVLGQVEPGSIHLQTFLVPTDDRLAEIEASDLQRRFAAVEAARNDAFAAFEPFKGTEGVKDSQDAILTLSAQGELLDLLRTFSAEELAILFKVSWVELIEGEPSVQYRKSEYPKCERSRLRRPDVESVTATTPQGLVLENVFLTARDRRVLGV